MVNNQVNDRLDTIIDLLEAGAGGGVSIEARDYIQCSGSGIVTDIQITSNLCIEIKFEDLAYNNNTSIFGCGTSGQPHLTLYSNKYFSGNNGAEWNFGAWSAGEHTFIFSNEDNECLFDGVVVKEDVTQPTISNTLTLGSRGSASSNVYKGRLKYIKIYDKDNDMALIHDIKPVVAYVDSNGMRLNLVQGLVDLVTGKSYVNSNWTISEV